ncbi:MAG TPA: ATP-binding protein [Gemmatimonadaceae bacterium]|nr:ATP-binding protein [Gemmatimonadaceae bacterium]
MTSRNRRGTSSTPEPSVQEALRRCVEQAPVPFAITRGDRHTLVYANSAFCRLAAIAPVHALGVRVSTAFAATRGRALSDVLDRAFRDGIEILDVRIPAPAGESERDWRCSVWPVIADDGQPEALGIEIRESSRLDDVLQLQRSVAEQMLLGALRERGLAEDAEAARRRATFLAEAGRLLAESVDHTSTLVALTKLALPTLGAWCIVDVLEEGNAIHRLGIYHPDPEKQKLAHELEATWVPQEDDPFGAPAMLRAQRTVAVTHDIEATLAKAASSAKNLHILRQLGIGSLLTVPLVAQKRLLGAITFVTAQRGVEFSREDVQLAEDLAGRGALALDNAQVHDLALALRRNAEAANRAKTAFLGAISHELRTPLNAIGGYIELLDMGLRGPVTESQHADFARVKANQKHLTLLITEILNFVRVGTGAQSYTVSEFNACDVLTHAIELIEPLVGQRGLIFDGIAGDVRVIARADRDKVTQILVNLLSNAIKFTAPGGHIGVECAASGDKAILRVRDTGIGIPADRLDAVFEPFVQLKDGFSDRSSGVGLGLAISRDLARAMEGDLTVESSEGQGTRFTLTLPGGSEPREA